MTTETSNARGEWVLVPREPSAGMLDSAENAMIESEVAYNAGEQAARSDAQGFPTMRIWQAVVAYRAMLAAAPQPPAEAQPGWYCAHCQRGVDAREVTYSEQHEVCGRHIANDDPPPSAPVGVDAPGSRAWMAEVCRAAALSLAAHGVRNDQLSKVADWIAQQPAAVDGADAKLALANDISRVFGNTNKAMTDHLWSLGYRKVATPHQEPPHDRRD